MSPAFFYALLCSMAGCDINPTVPLPSGGHKKNKMEKLTSIVKGTTAHLVHVCNGKVVYQIQTREHLYLLEIDSTEQEWETTYLTPSFKSITLMRWIRKGLENNDGTFIKLK